MILTPEIRIASVADAEQIQNIYAPIVETTIVSFETEVPSVPDMKARIEQTLKTHPWLVAEAGGMILGYAYASVHRSRPAYRWSCDVSVYVHETARRTGTARILYGHLFRSLDQQNYGTAYAGIALPNEASVGFHEAFGFTSIGVYEKVGYKLGAWHDVGWWGKKIQAPSDAPDEIIPFAELKSSYPI